MKVSLLSVRVGLVALASFFGCVVTDDPARVDAATADREDATSIPHAAGNTLDATASGTGSGAGAPAAEAGGPLPLDAATRDASAEDSSDAPPDSMAPATVSDAGRDADNPGFAFPPFTADGEPLPGVKGSWTYTEFPDSQCRDGSRAGVFVDLGSSNKLLIFLEGGGRCADEQTCAINPASVEDLLGQAVRSSATRGVLDRSRPENPVRDWSFVYVPYCTGDRHGGANPDANVPGVGPQRLVGHLNLKKFLNRIVPTFPNVSDVVFAGISAGGFGVAYNGVLVQRAFPNVKVKLVIDSAPFVSKAVFAECDQELTRRLYKAEETFLADCGAACPRPNDYWLDFGVFLARTFGDRPSGLISPTEDAVERTFFGIGKDGCSGALDLFDPGIPAAVFRSELLAARAQLEPFANFGTFYPEGDMHTLIAFDDFYTASAGGVKLIDWFSKIVNGASPGHAGP